MATAYALEPRITPPPVVLSMKCEKGSKTFAHDRAYIHSICSYNGIGNVSSTTSRGGNHYDSHDGSDEGSHDGDRQEGTCFSLSAQHTSYPTTGCLDPPLMDVAYSALANP